MQPTLRPMSLGEILDKAFVVYRKGFFIFLGVALLPIIGSAASGVSFGLLYELALQLNLGNLWVRASAKLPLWLPSWPRSFADILIWPILVYVASSFFLQQRTSLRAAVFQCIRRWQSWLGFGVFLFIVCVVVPQTAMQPLWIYEYKHFTLHPLGLSEWWAFLLYRWPFSLAEWILRYLSTLALGFSVIVWSVEQAGNPGAVRRGWNIARDGWFRLLVAMFMCDAIVYVLSVSLGVVREIAFQTVSMIFHDAFLTGVFSVQFGVFLVKIAHVLAAPLLPIAMTLIYYDVRVRREGFGVEKLMEAAGLLAPATAAIAPSAEAEIAQTAGSLSSPEMEIVPSAGSSPAP